VVSSEVTGDEVEDNERQMNLMHLRIQSRQRLARTWSKQESYDGWRIGDIGSLPGDVSSKTLEYGDTGEELMRVLVRVSSVLIEAKTFSASQPFCERHELTLSSHHPQSQRGCAGQRFRLVSQLPHLSLARLPCPLRSGDIADPLIPQTCLISQ
jgi:hypothetical protein